MFGVYEAESACEAFTARLAMLLAATVVLMVAQFASHTCTMFGKELAAAWPMFEAVPVRLTG